MSVEKIAPLGQTTMDLPTAMRPVVAAPAFAPRRAPFAPSPPTEPDEGPSHLFDALALPLPGAQDAGAPATARVSALYRETAASGAQILLIEGRLPVAAMRRAVETLLSDLAQSRGVPLAELIASAEKTEPDRLPSHNGEKARFAFRGRLAAADAEGGSRPLDLYLTRIGVREWEAAAYERTPARAAALFPRPTPLVDLHHLSIDPDLGLVRACMQWGPPRTVSSDGRPERRGVGTYVRIAAAVVGAAALATLFARGPTWEPSALLAAALVMALAAG